MKQRLRLEDFPEDLRGLLANITENVNRAVQRARETAVSLRESNPAPLSMKEQKAHTKLTAMQSLTGRGRLCALCK